MKFLRNLEVDKTFIKHTIFFLIIVIVAGIFLKNLYVSDGFYIGHDSQSHTARIAQYYVALKDGQIPPRWAQSLNYGLGNPIFVYIYPTPYLLGSLIHVLGFSFSDTFKILISLSIIVSGVFCYFWLYEVFKDYGAALLGALFYTIAPYKLSLVYIRSSLSEIVAYVFLPVVFWSLSKLTQKNYLKSTAISGFFIGVLLLSQNLVALMASPVIWGYILTRAIYKKDKKIILFGVLAYVLGLLLASATYFPSLFERRYILFDESIVGVYKDHFLKLPQLLCPPKIDCLFLKYKSNDEDLIPFQIGYAHILIFVISLIFLTMHFFKKRSKFFGKINHKHTALLLLFVVTFITSSIFMLDTALARFFWILIRPLSLIDVPWRFLGIVVFVSSYLAAFVVKFVRIPNFYLVLLLILILLNRKFPWNPQFMTFDDSYFLNYKYSATQYNEFMPVLYGTREVDERFYKPVEIVSGEVEINNLIQKSNLIKFRTESFSGGIIRINSIYFPGWELFKDGEKQKENIGFSLAKTSDEFKSSRNDKGLYRVKVAPGEQQFLLKYRETGLRKAGNIISIFTLIVIILIVFLPREVLVKSKNFYEKQ